MFALLTLSLALFCGSRLAADTPPPDGTGATAASRPSIAPPAAGDDPVLKAWKKADIGTRYRGMEGCFVLREIGGSSPYLFNPGRCQTPLTPCSTFKITNALIGLETGVLRDADHLLKWDGAPQDIPGCGQDLTLAGAIRHSCIWYFRKVAAGVGADRMQKYLDLFEYGNRDISGGLEQFWAQSSLTISAEQQAAFLERLYTDTLPLSSRAMDIVRGMLVLESGADWTFSGKTGSGAENGVYTVAWFVGHARHRGREFVFAANVASDGKTNGPALRKIIFQLAKDLTLIPAK